VHSAALQLMPILAAEKSKVPYYIAGGLLVSWALIVSLGLGLRRPEFPGNAAGQRAVLAITAALVLATVSTAVITSGTEAKAGAASTAAAPSAGGGAPSAPAAPTPAAPSTASSSPPTTPKATTAPPAPPSSPAAGKRASALKLEANPTGQLSYDTKQLSAKAGAVTITMTNMASLEHNVTVAEGSTVLGATPTFAGGSKTLTLALKPGTYTFYCSVPGHRQAGMEGTLSVS